MAIAVQVFSCKSQLIFCRPLVHKVRHSCSVAAVESVADSLDSTEEESDRPKKSHRKSDSSGLPSGNADCKAPEWKKLSSKDLGIRISMISKPTRLVLDALRTQGYKVYLVGGCVRDLILKKVPRDFDVVTSAELKEVLRTFPQCEVVGKRFPICHVHIDDTTVEVSSFSTSVRNFRMKPTYVFRKPPRCSEGDFIRWKNCLRRDFTINGLMFDPHANVVYDYMGGIEDIKKAKVRSVIPASDSFVEDCARILRGLRIAARLGFSFSRETARSVRELSSSVLRLDKKHP